MRLRPAAAAVALALAVPALAYVLPAPGILRRMGERRAALSLSTLEVSGTLAAEGAAAERLAAATGLPAAGGRVTVPARFMMRVPGRCRLEVALPDAAEAARPYLALRDGKVAGAGGLDLLPAAVALVRSACTLLATPVMGDPAQAYASALGRRGVQLSDVSLSRFDGRVAYVIGGHAKDQRPLAWVEKDAFRPLRLVAAEGGALRDVRLLGWGSPVGGDWFPGALEVRSGEAAELRFAAEKVTANPRLAEALFP